MLFELFERLNLLSPIFYSHCLALAHLRFLVGVEITSIVVSEAKRVIKITSFHHNRRFTKPRCRVRLIGVLLTLHELGRLYDGHPSTLRFPVMAPSNTFSSRFPYFAEHLPWIRNYYPVGISHSLNSTMLCGKCTNISYSFFVWPLFTTHFLSIELSTSSEFRLNRSDQMLFFLWFCGIWKLNFKELKPCPKSFDLLLRDSSTATCVNLSYGSNICWILFLM